MRYWIAVLGLLWAAPAFADESVLTTLIPVVSTDTARMTNELGSLIKAAQDAEAKAAYWKDACQSTPECSGGAVPVASK